MFSFSLLPSKCLKSRHSSRCLIRFLKSKRLKRGIKMNQFDTLHFSLSYFIRPKEITSSLVCQYKVFLYSWLGHCKMSFCYILIPWIRQKLYFSVFYTFLSDLKKSSVHWFVILKFFLCSWLGHRKMSFCYTFPVDRVYASCFVTL